ncbi:hypothetical protein RD110_05395 [Rhodoferax koreense]|uniref:Uncharacterized protein n=1 Tax=Rhodoferax koreensis TaxID=1842727 RepID=A0A1P8JSH2_9BURK|nr:hypothetical protein [Rhodoferax koreense]APW36696.1 hypothetical protein RD110_05395 [Rhodoferax koreense]
MLGFILLILLLLAAGLAWRHRGDADAYRRHFLQAQPAASPRFDELSSAMDEAALQRHLAGVPLRCISETRERQTLGDRVCWADIARVDAVPAMQFAAYFNRGRLAYVAIDLPWWAHHAALRQAMAQLGAPEAIDAKTAAQPAVQWRTKGGRLRLNRDPGFDPLATSALQWRADAIPPR